MCRRSAGKEQKLIVSGKQTANSVCVLEEEASITKTCRGLAEVQQQSCHISSWKAGSKQQAGVLRWISCEPKLLLSLYLHAACISRLETILRMKLPQLGAPGSQHLALDAKSPGKEGFMSFPGASSTHQPSSTGSSSWPHLAWLLQGSELQGKNSCLLSSHSPGLLSGSSFLPIIQGSLIGTPGGIRNEKL